MYRVAARKGAVVRKGIEMESSIAGIIEPGTRVVGEREATAACGTRRVFVRTAEVAGWLSLRVLEVDREAAKALEKREAQDRDARAKRLRGERLAAELARFVGRCGRLAPRPVLAVLEVRGRPNANRRARSSGHPPSARANRSPHRVVLFLHQCN